LIPNLSFFTQKQLKTACDFKAKKRKSLCYHQLASGIMGINPLLSLDSYTN